MARGERIDSECIAPVDPDTLGSVGDTDQREQYAAEAQRMAKIHDPNDPI